MALKDNVSKFPAFMRSFGNKKMFVVLLNFDWTKDYPIYKSERNKTKYYVIPAFFPPQELEGIRKGVKGGLLISQSCLSALDEALNGFSDAPGNHNLYGYYTDKTKTYTIRRVEGNFIDAKKDNMKD